MRKELPLIIAAILLPIFLALDKQIMNLIQLIHTPFLTLFLKIILILQKEPYIEIAILAIMFILFLKSKKKVLSRFVISFIISSVITLILKHLIGRERPLTEEKDSFPSGHSTVLFSAIPFLDNKIIHDIWLIISILFVFARVYFGMHYASDIIAGFIVGYGISLIIRKWKTKK